MSAYNREVIATRIEGARALRRRMTSAEAALWNQLRNRGLANLKFCRQHVVGSYVLDFCCPDERLVVEIDGDVHGDAEPQGYDIERTNYLIERGYRVIRFGNEDVLSDLPTVLKHIEDEAMSPNINRNT